MFGKGSGKAAWLPAQSSQDAILIRAARFQHQVSRRVRQLVEDNGASIAAVAAQVGVSPGMINDALNGHTHLHVTTLDAIANVLGLRLNIKFE